MTVAKSATPNTKAAKPTTSNSKAATSNAKSAMQRTKSAGTNIATPPKAAWVSFVAKPNKNKTDTDDECGQDGGQADNQDEVDDEDKDEDEDEHNLELGPFEEDDRPLNELFPKLASASSLAHKKVEVFLVFKNKANKPLCSYHLFKEAQAALNDCKRRKLPAAWSVVSFHDTRTQTGWFAWRFGATVEPANKRALRGELLKYMLAANKVLANKDDDDYYSNVDTTELEQLYHGTRVAIDTEGAIFKGVNVRDILDEAGIADRDHSQVVAFLAPYGKYIVSSANPVMLKQVAVQVRNFIASYNVY